MSFRPATLCAFLCAGLLPAMAPAVNLAPGMDDFYPTRDSLAAFYFARPLSFEALKRGAPERVDLIVWACHSRRLPDAASDPEVIANVRRFVENGGSLFLVGFAPAWTVALGLEKELPARMDHDRLGYGDQTPVHGDFRVGLRPRQPSPLFQGLTPDAERPDVFFLAANHSLNLEVCQWRSRQPRNGRVVALYARRHYNGDFLSPDDHIMLIQWSLGRGQVLGYGDNLCLEDFWYNHAQQNLERFLRNVARNLTGKENPRVAALPETPSRLEYDEYMSPPAYAQAQPHSLSRPFPGLPYIAHWGWHGQITYQRAAKESKPLAYYQQRLIDEPFRWGANLLEFYTPSMDDGYPFGWPENDPIAPPKAPNRYWGGDFDPNWNLEKARQLFRECHRRDMLVQIFYHPDPIRVARDSGADPVSLYSDFAEYQARELQNPLLHGWRAAHDGVGSEWWPSDQSGRYMSKLWMYNPGSYRYSTSILDKTGPYYSGTWMCAFARLDGINACGYGEPWRFVYHPPLYLSYQADCRSLKPSSREWGGWGNYGGGSTPDWILRQVNDFCRDRLYLDSSIWWLGEPAATLKEEDRPYVYGISMDPLRCAVATTMRAVGSDGYRAKALATLSDVPSQYACAEPYPQDTALIQNNYFRLLRMAGEDRGVLQYDPLRLAYYHATDRPRPAVELTDNFLSAAPVGKLGSAPIFPDGVVLDGSTAGKIGADPNFSAIGAVDHSNAEFKPSGGYDKVYACSADAAQFPGELCYERWPDWPQEVAMRFTADAGRYQVEIHALPVEYPCTMEADVDGRHIGVYFPAPGREGVYTLPFSLASSGPHTLLLRVQKADVSGQRKDGRPGFAHAFDALIIRNTAPQCVVHAFPTKVGHAAVLQEQVFKDPAAEYRQTRRYHVVADSPMFTVEIQNRAPGACAWETRLHLPRHGDLAAVEGAEATWRMAGRIPGEPALVLTFDGDGAEKIERRGEDVVITSPAQRQSTFTLGVLVDDGLYSRRQLPAVREAMLAKAPAVRLSGRSAEVKNPLDIPRVALVSVEPAGQGPYHVLETGPDGRAAWMVRGAQADGKRDLLRVYLQAHGRVRIQSYGYINGVVKPGYGCQYVLAIDDGVRPGRCEVDVLKTGPFVFAPRIEWKEPFDTVKVNGRPWRYFDGTLVFLPNRPAHYVVEVQKAGGTAPCLTRTFLDVESSSWDAAGKVLEVRTRAPHWWEGPLPGDIDYVAQLHTAGLQPASVEGGELVPWSEFRATDADREKMAHEGAVIRLKPGVTRIHFR